jgi:hypothetical protein
MSHLEEVIRKKRDEYFKVLDRIYLNEGSLKKVKKNTKFYKEIKEQIKKDKELKKEYEEFLGI